MKKKTDNKLIDELRKFLLGNEESKPFGQDIRLKLRNQNRNEE